MLNIIFGKADELAIESGRYICVGNCVQGFARKQDVDCRKCPPGWIDGVKEGDVETILFSPDTRKMIMEQKQRQREEKIAREMEKEEGKKRIEKLKKQLKFMVPKKLGVYSVL